MMTRLYSYVCALHVCVSCIHLHAVKILGIRVIAISYDLHVPLNTLLKYSLQLLVQPL